MSFKQQTFLAWEIQITDWLINNNLLINTISSYVTTHITFSEYQNEFATLVHFERIFRVTSVLIYFRYLKKGKQSFAK